MKCTICGKQVVLVPSAEERARKFGGTANDYTQLFTTHSQCQINKNSADALDTMKRICNTTK